MAFKRLPDPPKEYNLDAWQKIIGQITMQLRALDNPGHVQGTTINLTELPTSSAGLRSGDVWRDAGAGNVLKIVP